MNIAHTIQTICVYAIPLLFAITMHEAAHGWMASKFGDNTARMLGRVTLNPLPHVDPFGTIALPLIMLVGSSLAGMGGMIFGLHRWSSSVRDRTSSSQVRPEPERASLPQPWGMKPARRVYGHTMQMPRNLWVRSR